MKTRALVCAALCGISALHSQPPGTTLSPSIFYTAGSYSNGTSANSAAGYASLSWNGLDYAVAGVENMKITSSPWTYDQQLFVVGGLKNLYPFYLTAHYGMLVGTFTLPVPRYSYQDHLHIVNAGLAYNVDMFFLGLTYTYVNVRGYKRLESHQSGVSAQWLVDPALSIDLHPLYTSLTDGRAFTSVSAELSYSPWLPFLLQISGTAGRRAYFFNPKLLTFFNQDQTQKNLWGVRGEYTLEKTLTFIASYQSSEFEGYTARYLSLGARINIGL
jgi:hypothetical protein